jgi:chromosome partitioning protein
MGRATSLDITDIRAYVCTHIYAHAQLCVYMIITIASHKGGVGKTTTAIHFAAYLQTVAPTLLLDGDDTRNATAWGGNGPGFAFRIADLNSAAMLAPKFTHVVIDTGQRPTDTDMQALAEGCDLMVIPAVPAGLDSVGLVQTIRALTECRANYRVLLTNSNFTG